MAKLFSQVNKTLGRRGYPSEENQKWRRVTLFCLFSAPRAEGIDRQWLPLLVPYGTEDIELGYFVTKKVIGSSLQALANRPVRALLTQLDEDIRVNLGNLPENATIAGFVPHSPVLKKSSIVINHAGHGIFSKAMTYGVPMVLLPWDRDQPGVVAKAKKLSLAQVVPRSSANPQDVHKAVAALFKDTRYRESAFHHSRRLATTDSTGTAYSLLEEFLITME